MEYAIRIEALGKRYGELKAVDNLNLDIMHDEVFGFLGPNGAGKTTTLHMICGLLKPDSGSISFPGHPGKAVSELIGYCPQENIHYPKLTCSEQLSFYASMHNIPAKEAGWRSRELLGMLGLEVKSNVLASRLSGGMKRRLNIALALIHDPPVLILDEPEAGLDPQSRVLVREVIRELSRQRTVLLSTHNMDEADRLASRIAIIDHGKLLVTDTPINLKKSIGEGDILEVILEGEEEINIQELKETCSSLIPELTIVTLGNSLLIKGRELPGRIAAISGCTAQAGGSIREIRLRQNTLEDVFIHLTGRELRA